MFLQTMPISLAKATELLDALVHRLMPASISVFYTALLVIFVVIRYTNVMRFPMVTSIRFHSFTIPQEAFKFMTKDLDIRPPSSWIWPNNL